LFGTIAGVTVFLAFLTIAVQILMNLYSTSVVTSAAYDAARQVASEGQRPPLDDDAKERAEAHARSLLGGLGEATEFTWIEDDPDVVQLRVVTRSPRFLLPVVDGALGLDEIDRTVTVRLEDLEA
jgi:hypothetical protein